MIIGFTGHRNATTTEKALTRIMTEFPGAVWCHGGAVGFDSQVDAFARKNGVKTQVIRPDYAKNGKPAPLIRNREIVGTADVMFACYDGRKGGGTDYTAKYAIKQGKKVHFLTCILDDGREMVAGQWGLPE